MTLQISGPLSLFNLQSEFGGADPIAINEYYRGGGLVEGSTLAGTGSTITNPQTGAVLVAPAQISTSGQIQLSQFYGTRAVIIGNAGISFPPAESYTTSDYTDLTLPAGVNLIRFFLVGGGGGGGGSNSVAGGNGGGGSTVSGTVNTSWAGPTNVDRILRLYIGRGGQRGTSGVPANSNAYPAARGGHGYPMNGITSTSWGAWMNLYAVAWDFGVYEANPGQNAYRTLWFPNSGTYTFQFLADNAVQIYVDGTLIANTSGNNDSAYNGGGSYSLASPLTRTVSLSAGMHKVRFYFTNTGSIGGYACRIVNNSTSSELWTTRYEYDGWKAAPVGGNGGYPGNYGASGMGGGGGSATMLSIVMPGGTEYPIAIAGGGGGGGGGGAVVDTSVRRDANWATQGWNTVDGFPRRVCGGDGEYGDRPNNGSRSGISGDGGGGGGGGGVTNDRQYVQITSKDWRYSGFGGRTSRGNMYNVDISADGGESGKSFVSTYATRYADVMHVPTTTRFPIFPSNPSGVDPGVMTALNNSGHGGVGSTATNLNNGSAGLSGAAYIDWGLTNSSVLAPTVARAGLIASIVCYELIQVSVYGWGYVGVNRIVMPQGGSTSFTLDGFGGGGNPGAEYSYSWQNVAGTASISGATSYRCSVTAPNAAGESGVIRLTVSDGSSTATKDFTWYVVDPDPPPEGGACFPAGSKVMMADGYARDIETVKVGDMVMSANGPTEILALEKPALGSRKLFQAPDGHTWTEEHAHWSRDDQSQWWWAETPTVLLDTMRTGPGFELAHLEGWKNLDGVQEVTAPTDMQLYLPVTDGAPIIVNGYLVGSAISESYDYSNIDWDAVQPDLLEMYRVNSGEAPPSLELPEDLPEGHDESWAPPPVEWTGEPSPPPIV